MVREFALSVMGRRIDPSWGGPIELFLVPARAPRPIKVFACVGHRLVLFDSWETPPCMCGNLTVVQG